MFDIGFTELLLVGVVALIVVGPERLPSLIRTTLRYIRQIKSGFAHVRDEVERELDLKKLQDEILEGKDDFKNSLGYDEVSESVDDLRKTSEELRNIANDGYEYADNFIDDHVLDVDIEADLNDLVKTSERQLPEADNEADTGIEGVAVAHEKSSITKQLKKNKTT